MYHVASGKFLDILFLVKLSFGLTIQHRRDKMKLWYTSTLTFLTKDVESGEKLTKGLECGMIKVVYISK